MLRYFLILASLVIVVGLVLGCDDRGTNIVRTEYDTHLDSGGTWSSAETSFARYLTWQPRNQREQLLATAYIPAEAVPIPPKDVIPMLILLAPENGNKFHYFQAGLDQLVKDLTATGQIQPMVIYCIGNDQTFGGYFYADSDPGGRYDSVFTDNGTKNTLIRWLHETFPATIESPAKRGIGGVGQGAYGAMRAAINHPGLFSSVSIADGPLDFDGPSGNGGLTRYFDDVMAEQESYYLRDPFIDTVVVGTDTTFNVIPYSYHRDFDSSHSLPLSNMFIGGAFAFSPNDTLIVFDRIVNSTGTQFNVIVTARHSMAGDDVVGGGDSTTFISTLIKTSEQTRNLDLDFHLPFDSNGVAYGPIWSMWMRNNLDSLYLNSPTANPLANTNIFVATNAAAKWSYDEMTRSWLTFLGAQGVDYQDYRYGSYTDEPIVEDEYLFDVLREMLIFHSESFGD
jgi:S-formylglutathione hydrolase FrmB